MNAVFLNMQGNLVGAHSLCPCHYTLDAECQWRDVEDAVPYGVLGMRYYICVTPGGVPYDNLLCVFRIFRAII